LARLAQSSRGVILQACLSARCRARRWRRVLFFAPILALLLAFGPSAQAADSNDEDVARSFVDGLPAVLSTADADLYRKIFALQEAGKLKAADKLIAQLGDDRLMGYVLYQRYMHPTAYRSGFKELRVWLDHYADQPGAKRIYALAMKRRKANYRYPRKPALKRLSVPAAEVRDYRSDKPRNRSTRKKVYRIKRQIRRNVLSTRLSVTEELLNSAKVRKLLDKVEIDEGFSRVSAAWFFYGKTEKAYAMASAAANRSGRYLPSAHWIAGLAAWRLGDLETAAAHFEAVAKTEYADDWLVSAGAFWAARTHLKLRHPAEMSRWLSIAARHEKTFYGLLAGSALGVEQPHNFGRPTIDGTLLARLEAKKAGRRALALLQIGQRGLAEQELLHFDADDDPMATEALLTLAVQARMPSLAFRLGNILSRSDSLGGNAAAVDGALYPIPPWQPKDGFKLDRALIFALVRQESAFNPRAKSRDGARGLMQLMPQTASFISKGQRYRGSRRDELFEPSLNLSLGQRYLSYLLTHDKVGGDLFRLTTAYNGGPGNLQKWERKIAVGDDQLLFIESLPSRETRHFVEKVLANLWIYRLRLGQSTPSRIALARGQWPRYESLDIERSEVARNEPN